MKNQNFEILEEETKVRLRISGETPEDLFAAALAGIAGYLKPDANLLKRSDLKEWQRIQVEALDIVSLLAEFLNKVLSETELKGAVFSAVSFEKFGENFLEGKIFGTKAENINKEIKAVSFEEVDIKKNPETGLYETSLILEV